MGGGDLLNLLIEKDIFEEDFARFYVAEMILSIHEAHRLGYIHRDIKPDNFLFTSKGHVKLADFGLCQSFHWAHDGAYYDQQRKHLLKKHGIDLEDGAAKRRPGAAGAVAGAGGKPARTAGGALNEKELKDIMSDRNEDGTPMTHVLTWRDKNKKKIAYSVVGECRLFRWRLQDSLADSFARRDQQLHGTGGSSWSWLRPGVRLVVVGCYCVRDALRVPAIRVQVSPFDEAEDPELAADAPIPIQTQGFEGGTGLHFASDMRERGSTGERRLCLRFASQLGHSGSSSLRLWRRCGSRRRRWSARWRRRAHVSPVASNCRLGQLASHADAIPSSAVTSCRHEAFRR